MEINVVIDVLRIDDRTTVDPADMMHDACDAYNEWAWGNGLRQRIMLVGVEWASERS